jgi:hypothetical protein
LEGIFSTVVSQITLNRSAAKIHEKRNREEALAKKHPSNWMTAFPNQKKKLCYKNNKSMRERNPRNSSWQNPSSN